MKFKGFYLLMKILFVIVIFDSPVAEAQSNIGRNKTSMIDQKYSRILGILFYEDESKQTDVLSSITVRFLPSFLPESQITIIRKGSSSKLIYVRAKSSVYSKLNEMLARDNSVSDEEIANAIKIEKKDYDLKTLIVDRWLNDFHFASAKSLEQINKERIKSTQSNTIEVYLDGTFYQFWSENQLNKVHLSLYDENIDPLRVTGSSALVKISNKLRLEIENGFFK